MFEVREKEIALRKLSGGSAHFTGKTAIPLLWEQERNPPTSVRRR